MELQLSPSEFGASVYLCYLNYVVAGFAFTLSFF